MKTCSKCKESKNITEFNKDASKPDKLCSCCKACKNIAMSEYLAVPENREKHNANSAKWDAANSDVKKLNNAKWYANNTDKCNANSAKWYAENTEKKQAQNKKWAIKNPEKMKEYAKAWSAANPSKRLAYVLKWQEKNPDASRNYAHNRRAQKLKLGGKLSKDLAEKLIKLQKGRCTCGCNQPLGTSYHLDHIMPLALGGDNTDNNIQLLRAKCNMQKSKKHPVDFMRQKGFLL